MPLLNEMPKIFDSTERPVLPDEYKVEKIIAHQWNAAIGHRTGWKLGRMEYKVKWIGFEECTWEPYEHFASDNCEVVCDKLIQYLHMELIDL